MKTYLIIRQMLIGSALLLVSSAIWASTCSYQPSNPSGNGPLIVSMPLQGGTITAGRDMPDGAVLFRQTFRTVANAIQINCLGSVTTIQRVRRLTSTPRPLIPGRPEFQGQVYETGVAGIGVAIWYAGNGFPYTDSIANCGGGSGCNWDSYSEFDISLIKTGPIDGGSVLGNQLPTASLSWVTGNSLEILRVTFSGTINVVTPTCNTPNVNVPLGEYRIQDLKGVNTGTPWRDFEIRLTNCPAISGYFTGGVNNYPIWYNDGTGTAGNRTGHTVTYRLTPQAGSVDAAQGIARLTASRPGNPPAAGGIGIQIANRSNQPRPLGSFLPGVTMRVGQLGGQSMAIPLRARYIQVADTVTPGPANTAVEFLLNYQ